MASVESSAREVQAVERLAQKLKSEKGFPSDLIAPHLGFPDGSFVDLVLLHPDPRYLLAAFEVKVAEKLDAQVTLKLRGELQRLSAFKFSIPIYGVISTDNEDHFYQLAEDSQLVPFDLADFPTFSGMLGTVAVRKEVAKSAALRAIDRKAYLLAGGLVFLFAFAQWKWWTPTWELLALLAGIVLLLFLPDLKRVRAGDFEAELWPTAPGSPADGT